MDVAALVLSIAAVGIASWAAVSSHRSAGHSRRSADASERSAGSAEEAVGYKRQEVERGRVDFQLHRIDKDTYLLTNAGTNVAYGVEVDVGDLIGHDTKTAFDTFPDGHSEEYLLFAGMTGTTTHIEVTWHHQPDQSDATQTKHLYVER